MGGLCLIACAVARLFFSSSSFVHLSSTRQKKKKKRLWMDSLIIFVAGSIHFEKPVVFIKDMHIDMLLKNCITIYKSGMGNRLLCTLHYRWSFQSCRVKKRRVTNSQIKGCWERNSRRGEWDLSPLVFNTAAIAFIIQHPNGKKNRVSLFLWYSNKNTQSPRCDNDNSLASPPFFIQPPLSNFYHNKTKKWNLILRTIWLLWGS